MQQHLATLLVLGLACTAAAGCDLFKKDSDTTPTTPTPNVSLDVFTGSWASITASTPATGCGNIKYTVTPVTSTTANVTFTGTCASNIQVTGTGAGTISGSALQWTAQGSVTQGTLTCPFNFTNSQAVQDTAGIKVTYSGTVCGIAVSGSELVKKG